MDIYTNSNSTETHGTFPGTYCDDNQGFFCLDFSDNITVDTRKTWWEQDSGEEDRFKQAFAAPSFCGMNVEQRGSVTSHSNQPVNVHVVLARYTVTGEYVRCSGSATHVNVYVALAGAIADALGLLDTILFSDDGNGTSFGVVYRGFKETYFYWSPFDLNQYDYFAKKMLGFVSVVEGWK